MTQTLKKLMFCLTALLFFLLPPVRTGLLAALCALLLAALAEKPVSLLEERGFPRQLGVLLLYSSVLAAAAALLWFLISWLCREVNIAVSLSSKFGALLERLEAFTGLLPDGARQLALRGVVLLREKGVSFWQQLLSKAARWSAALAAALPGRLLFLLIVLTASAFAAADWPQLCRQGEALLPKEWVKLLRRGAALLKHGVLVWLTTQGKLMALQFGILSLVLAALKIPNAVLKAAFIALADALPLLGAGSVLVPWALFAWLNGRTARGVWLCVLSFLLWAVRTALEPRLLGKQTRLSSYYTVIALYLGMLCFGLWGAIAAPVLLTAGAQLFRLQKQTLSDESKGDAD